MSLLDQLNAASKFGVGEIVKSKTTATEYILYEECNGGFKMNVFKTGQDHGWQSYRELDLNYESVNN